MSEKKFRFNAVDLIILLAVAAVILFAGSKIISANKDITADTVTASLTFYCEEVPDYAVEIIKKDASVSDQAKKIFLGKITSVSEENSLVYTTDSNGARMPYVKENVKNLKITTEVPASEFTHGVIIESAEYSVGHSLTIYAGKAKIDAKISAVEIK